MQFVRNPYLNRAAVRSPESFFGRRSEIARLAQRIAADSPQSVAIVGDRRIGKSSVLSYISHQTIAESYLEDPGQTIFLSMDFQQERRLTTESFIQSVCRHLGEKLGDRVPPGTADYDGLVSVVEDLDRSGLRLILLLDEFDRVTRSSSFDADFFAFLRSLGGHKNIAFVTSSSRNLQELCHTQEIADSPFFNIFSTVQLGPLKEAEARELICLPSKDTPFPLEDHTDSFSSWVGCGHSSCKWLVLQSLKCPLRKGALMRNSSGGDSWRKRSRIFNSSGNGLIRSREHCAMMRRASGKSISRESNSKI